MADFSILEYAVYGFIAYTSVLMLIISTIKEVPNEKSGSIIRSIWLMPGVICAFILSSTNSIVVTGGTVMNNTITAVNSSQVFTEVATTASTITLQNPIWVLVHFMFAIILIIYIITQMLNLFTKIE